VFISACADSLTFSGLSTLNRRVLKILESKNSYAEFFWQDSSLRREVLNTEWFATTRQAQTVINQWLRQYNHIRPHHALGMRPPVPETILVNH